MPADLYNEKVGDAGLPHFRFVKDVQPSRVKKGAVQLWIGAGLVDLAASVKKANALNLTVFFSAKTHKEGCPFRVIASEKGTWQLFQGLYLQRSLSLLASDDPFLVRNQNEINTFMNTLGNKKVGAFLADVKDLYYSLLQGPILEAVSDCLDEYEAVSFWNTCGTNVSAFL
ncbi:hypothetical protein HPB48_008918 [Haemaphysalis longicornis]|uniref:Uncharacterized protein n=1 Tax=Haemaphysalis longicornis TaxID=44386 RepID=A0A9J6GJT8_HAELO|nr:hypothetical protein HPB48_008918 [Haemaphysalis longicornis]